MRNMTEGNVGRHLRKFLVPLLIGNVFQQFYNMADSIIVGRYVGKEALAAVGCANPVMSIALFLIIGVTIGSSILTAEFFGRGDMEKIKKQTATSLCCGVFFTVFLALLFFFLTSPLLKLINTPSEIFNDCANYLKIIFCGLIFSFTYNLFAQSLRAVGDSKTPLIFLCVSVIANIIFDLLFVIQFNFGVKGVAYATIISQAICAVAIVIYVYIKVPELRLKINELKIDFSLLKTTFNYSWVTAMQQTVLYVGKLLVQGAVNPLGVDSIAAYNAVARIDAFGMAPSDSLNSAITTFTAQNHGAGKNDRLPEGFKTSLKMGLFYNITITFIVFFLARPLMKIFVDKKDVEAITIGVEYLRAMSPFYFMLALCNVFQGFFRGLGDLKVTLLATTINLSSRIIFAYILCGKIGLAGVAVATVVGWAILVIFEYSVYKRLKRNDYVFGVKAVKEHK